MAEHPIIREARLRLEDAGDKLVRAKVTLEREMEGQIIIPDPVELAKVQTATSLDLRKDIESLERFTGHTGELAHFIKGADRVSRRIGAKRGEGRLTPEDEESLRATLICRIHRAVLNKIQADEDTPWDTVKERLRKEYGDGRWAPEEDILAIFRSFRGATQSRGEYAANLLSQFTQINAKVREVSEPEAADARMAFVEAILRVQLGVETGKPRNKPFVEAAHELMDAQGRGEEEPEPDPRAWRRVISRRREHREHRAQVQGEVRRTPDRPVVRRETPRPVKTERRPERRDRRREAPRRGSDERRCHACGKTGHLRARCPQTKCYECNAPGHVARNCPYLYRRRSHDRGEPMEVNLQSVRPRRSWAQVVKEVPESETDTDSSAITEPGRGRPSSRSSAGSLRRPAPRPAPRRRPTESVV